MAYIENLKPTILAILHASDLGSVSTKDVRAALLQNPQYAKKVPASLSVEGADRHEINGLIKTCFAEIQVEQAAAPVAPAPVAPAKRGRKTKAEEPAADGPQNKKQRKRRPATPESKARRAAHPNNAFSAPLILDEPLAALCEGNDIPRYEIIRRIWKYIKENNLQDPAHKRTIICDAKLQTIIPRERIDSFEVAKFIGAHVTRKPKVDQAAASASPAPTSPVTEAEVKESDAESADTKQPTDAPEPKQESPVEEGDDEKDEIEDEE